MKKIDVNTIKTQHKQLIIREILKEQLVSRNSLAAELSLSVVTVANLLAELGEAEFFREVRDETSTVGRKPNLIQVLPANKLFLTFDLSSYAFSACVMDLGFSLVKTLIYVYDGTVSYCENLARFIGEVRDNLRGAGLAARIVDIGVSVPGAYDGEKDRVLSEKVPDLFTVHIGELFQKHFGRAVRIEHDVRLMFVNDSQRIESFREKSIFYLYIGDGISGVISINGATYGGAIDIAGEVGGMLVCGGKTLNELLMWDVCIERLKAPYYSGAEELEPAELLDFLGQRYAAGDAELVAAVDVLIDALSHAFFNTVYFLNPHEILINSWLRVFGNSFIDKLCQKLAKMVQPFVMDNMRIVFTDSTESGNVLGLGILLREWWVEDISRKEAVQRERRTNDAVGKFEFQ